MYDGVAGTDLNKSCVMFSHSSGLD